MATDDTGRIVFARTGAGTRAGAVLERGPARCIVLTEEGAKETWTLDRIVWSSEVRIPVRSAREASEAIAAMVGRVRELRQGIDLGELWDLLSGSRDASRVSDLADILFPGAGPDHRAATAWALAEDEVWFRAAADQAYVALSPETVTATLNRRRREEQEAGRIERAAAELQDILDGRKLLEEAEGAGRAGLGWLRNLAVHADPEGGRGPELARRLGGGDSPEQAFALLVRLGAFHEDEILAVHRNRIRTSFSRTLVDEAERLAEAELPDEEARDRTVLEWAAGSAGPLAIDDPWTRDVDDALMVEAGDGCTRVHVLIADPSALIPFPSPLAAEGMSRSATLYLPTGKIPMFPPILSEGALSLARGLGRPMLDFECSIDPAGVVTGFAIKPVFATLAAHVTYDEADRLIADPQGPVGTDLRTLATLAKRLRDRRIEAGAFVVERDEFSVRVVDGDVRVTRLPSDSPGRRLVAEFMVLACSLAGRFAREHGIPAVYRRQGRPDDPGFARLLMAGSEDRGPGDELEPGLRPGTRAWAFRMIRYLRRAELTTQPDSHFGLGVVGYTQVTSPLRRFQDFLVHVQLKGFLRHGRAPLDAASLLKTFGDLESQVDALTQTEREARRYYLLKALARLEGTEVTAEVVQVNGSRGIVELEDFGLDLPATGMGRAALGSRVWVRVHEVSPRRDRVVLSVEREVRSA